VSETEATAMARDKATRMAVAAAAAACGDECEPNFDDPIECDK